MSKKLKIGLIGAGGIAQGAHMKGYASVPDECEMVLVCDVNPETAKSAAEKFSISKTTTDYREVIENLIAPTLGTGTDFLVFRSAVRTAQDRRN